MSLTLVSEMCLGESNVCRRKEFFWDTSLSCWTGVLRMSYAFEFPVGFELCKMINW